MRIQLSTGQIITVPPEVVARGGVAAYAAEAQGEIAFDQAACPLCLTPREFYHETCECGGAKPWLFNRELPGRASRPIGNRFDIEDPDDLSNDWSD